MNTRSNCTEHYHENDMLTAITPTEFRAGGRLDLLNDGVEDTLTILNRFGCWQMSVGDLMEWAASIGSNPAPQ